MAAIDIVNRVFREFKRYTGDGLANEPVGAPLPVGDPASGPHNPKKADLREALLAPIDAAAQSASDAADTLAQFLTHFLGNFADDAAAATAAGTAVEGQFYWNTTSKVFRHYDGADWQVFPYATVADDAITTAKLVDGVVTEPKLARSLSARVGAMFDTVAELLADTTLSYVLLSEGDIIEAGGFRYKVAASAATDQHAETAGGVKLYQLSGVISEELTFKVPTDYPDIETAIKELGPLQASGRGERVIILIESGYELTAGVTIRRGFYGHIWIKAEDATVPLVTDIGSQDAFYFEDCFAPVIDFIIDCQGNGDGLRYSLCVARIGGGGAESDGGGCINSNNRGVEIAYTHLTGDGAVFDDCANIGVRVSNSSLAKLRGISAQRSGGIGITVTGSSVCNIQQGVEPSNFSGATLDGVSVANSSLCTMQDAIAQNCGRDGLNVFATSYVNAENTVLTGNGRSGVAAFAGSTVNIQDADISGNDFENAWAAGGSEIHGVSVNADSAGRHAFYADDGARMSIVSSTALNAGNTGVLAQRGSNVLARSVDTTGSVGSGFKIENGSMLTKVGGSGTTSTTVNTLSANGILFSS